MIAVISRVAQARVEVGSAVAGAIDKGLLILLGVAQGDGPEQVAYLASKIANFRIFADQEGKMNLSLLEVSGEALVVSQFTLLGSWRKGRRPSFDKAAPPPQAALLVEAFIRELERLGVSARQGVFGAHMMVYMENDGPVTFVMDTSAPD